MRNALLFREACSKCANGRISSGDVPISFAALASRQKARPLSPAFPAIPGHLRDQVVN